MISSRLQEDFLEMVGALATGLGLEAFSAGKEANPTKKNIPLFVDLGIGAVGVIGASQIGGSVASLAEGITAGALAHAGSWIYRLYKQAPSSGGVGKTDLQTLYAVPYYEYSGGYSGGSSIIEI